MRGWARAEFDVLGILVKVVEEIEASVAALCTLGPVCMLAAKEAEGNSQQYEKCTGKV